MSQFLSMVLLATTLTLTLCFGVAAWRAWSDKKRGHHRHSSKSIRIETLIGGCRGSRLLSRGW